MTYYLELLILLISNQLILKNILMHFTLIYKEQKSLDA